MSTRIGYCTNIHAGVTLEEVKANLTQFAMSVGNSIGGDDALPVGLWLSQTAADELASRSQQERFRDWLIERRLNPYTLNGFPYGDFHQPVVKHEVYKPTWAEVARLNYTQRLADIQACLLDGFTGESTISTLPLGWPTKQVDESFYEKCASNLIELVKYLARLKTKTGIAIRVCLEPEPGCVLDTAGDLVAFFEEFLFANEDAGVVREHLGVCHDVCHSAVMFEKQADAVDRYRNAGIEIGKVQVSSALETDFDQTDDDNGALLEELSRFAEPRYLHQTTVNCDGRRTFYEDLGLAIADHGDSPRGQWRVHFHVPIFQKKIGRLQTTQSDILQLVEVVKKQHVFPQWEVETYAWNVLPENLQSETLSQSVSRELEWFQRLVDGN